MENNNRNGFVPAVTVYPIPITFRIWREVEKMTKGKGKIRGNKREKGATRALPELAVQDRGDPPPSAPAHVWFPEPTLGAGGGAPDTWTEVSSPPGASNIPKEPRERLGTWTRDKARV